MEGDKHTYLNQPKVTFQIVSRQLSAAQAEAGKRLFKRLVARAQLSTQIRNEPKNIDMKT